MLPVTLAPSWIHGNASDPPIQVHKCNPSTYILRISKTIHYEGNFIYLLFGEKYAFLQDTGPVDGSPAAPLYETVMKIVDEWNTTHPHVTLLVTHSHSHDDHIQGDAQFLNKPNVQYVGTSLEEVQKFFGFKSEGSAEFDLGGRVLDIIHTPGHEQNLTDITVYDRLTGLLLTGDIFYPGRLYVRNFQLFKASIERLVSFCKQNTISFILGNHIEMTSTPEVDYPVETVYQPEECKLELTPEDLQELLESLRAMGDTFVYKTHKKFITFPRT